MKYKPISQNNFKIVRARATSTSRGVHEFEYPGNSVILKLGGNTRGDLQ